MDRRPRCAPGRALPSAAAPDRLVSWTALGSTATLPPHATGAGSTPQAPHRAAPRSSSPAYGPSRCVYKVGITHCVDDHRLGQHLAAGGELLQVIDVLDRATAFAIETAVLAAYQTAAPPTLAPRTCRRVALPNAGTRSRATPTFTTGLGQGPDTAGDDSGRRSHQMRHRSCWGSG